MKRLATVPIALSAWFLTACGSDRAGQGVSEAYAKLKAETGASDEQLSRIIKFFREVQRLTDEGLDDGSLTPEMFIEANKMAQDGAEFLREERIVLMATTMGFLKRLEEDGAEVAAVEMAGYLEEYRNSDFPQTELAEQLRSSIGEYAEGSEAFAALRRATPEDGGN